jgi:hypothetical protein
MEWLARNAQGSHANQDQRGVRIGTSKQATQMGTLLRRVGNGIKIKFCSIIAEENRIISNQFETYESFFLREAQRRMKHTEEMY